MIVCRPRTIRLAALLFMLPLVSQAPSLAAGQEGSNLRFIEVIGSGTAAAKPDSIQLEASISAKGESAKEALKKFEEKKKELANAMDPMEMPGVSILFSKASVNRGMDMEGGVVMMVEPMMEEGPMPDAGFSVEQKANITLAIDPMISPVEKMNKLSRLIDAAIENKASVGDGGMMFQFTGEMPSGFVRGVVKDMDSLAKAAEEKAFANAKAQAERMAALAGGTVGKVISVSVNESEIDSQVSMILEGAYSAKDDNSLEEVKVTSSLRVRFELK